MNFLSRASLIHAIPKHLKTNDNYCGYSSSPNLKIDYKDFNVLENRSKDYCDFFVMSKAEVLSN